MPLTLKSFIMETLWVPWYLRKIVSLVLNYFKDKTVTCATEDGLWFQVTGGVPQGLVGLNTMVYWRPMVFIYCQSFLWVICGFWIVSYEVACFMTRTPPIELIVEERMYSYNRVDRISALWSLNSKDIVIWHWTSKLSIQSWVDGKHGEVDYYLIQVFKKNGCFLAYHHRFKVDNAAECPVSTPKVVLTHTHTISWILVF